MQILLIKTIHTGSDENMQKLQILFDKDFDNIHTSLFIRKYDGFSH